MRKWCAVVVSVTVMGVLPGCQGGSDHRADSSASAAAQQARARRTRQVEQESERLRKERDRLKAELSAKRTESPVPKPSRATTGPSPSGTGSAGLKLGFDELAARLGGSVGLAYASAAGTPTMQLGSWRTGPGWSTVKVPLAVAAVVRAHGRPDAGVKRLMRLSVTASDNAAAEGLWAYLGEPASAAAQVQAVLRSAGDADTRVQARRVRPGFSAFGQTTWTLASQAAFVSRLPCIEHGAEVSRLMGDVEASQRWGIGAVGLTAQLKGGWGPGPGGGYLVRQMGILIFANGSRLALAIASEPADGRFETGTANLTALALWAVANVKVRGPVTC